MTPEEKMASLGLELKDVPVGSGALIPWVQVGNLLYLSGRVADRSGKQWRGKLGREYTVEEGREAARECAWSLLCAAKSALGDLSRVRRVVKLLGFVNSDPEFSDQPLVMNGCSELLVEVFGEAGRHARSAVGMAGLPGGHPVEVEMILEVE